MHFATLFDKNYLSRGLVLLESLSLYLQDFKLFVLCLDNDVFDYFIQNKLENVILITLNDLEKDNVKLQQAKSERSLVEYYFTLSPCLPLYVLKKNPGIPFICTLDSDISFYSSPESIFKVLDTKSIIITPHKYAKKFNKSSREKSGRYNVSFQTFKNNSVGLECLQDWETKCIAWCHDYFDEANQRFADQKYLDDWITDYPGQVHVLEDAATGLAVWNIDNYTFSLNNNKVYVNGDQQLIFYHFHHFKLINSSFALNGFGEYSVKNSSRILANNVYLPYWEALNKYNLLINSSSDNSIRLDLKKSFLKLLLIHRTGFFKKFTRLFNINVTLLQVMYVKLKSI